MDVYGDHAMSCPRASFVARHQWLADGLARVAALSGAHVHREVAVAGLLRPAVLLISGGGQRAVALDVTVRHGLAEFDNQGNRLERAALSKHIRYDELCRQSQLDFQVFALSTLGAADDEAVEFLGTLKARLEERFGKREGRELAQRAVERLAVAAMRGVGALLLVLSCSSCSSAEEEVPPGSLVRSAATAHDGDDYESWAEEHGFAPAPASNVPGSWGSGFWPRRRYQRRRPNSSGGFSGKTRSWGAGVWVRD